MGLEPIVLKAMRVCAFLVIASTALGPTAFAQSLADVARKESERREAVKDSGKTYTNHDLKPVPTSAPTDAAPADTSGGAAASADAGQPDSATGDSAADTKTADAPGSTTPGEPVKDEAYWAGRMADLRERLERDGTFADALQSRIDALTTDFVNRDDPAQRGQIGADRQKALVELDRLKKNIEQDKRAIPELEEEARRAGVPAGWLR